MGSQDNSSIEELVRELPPAASRKHHNDKYALDQSLWGPPSTPSNLPTRQSRSWTLDLGLPAQTVRSGQDYSSLAQRANRPRPFAASKRTRKHAANKESSSSSSSAGPPIAASRRNAARQLPASLTKRKAKQAGVARSRRTSQAQPQAGGSQAVLPGQRPQLRSPSAGYAGDSSSSASGTMLTPSGDSSLGYNGAFARQTPKASPGKVTQSGTPEQRRQDLMQEVVANLLRASPMTTSPTSNALPTPQSPQRSTLFSTPSSSAFMRRRRQKSADALTTPTHTESSGNPFRHSKSSSADLQQIQQMRRVSDLLGDDDSDGSESVSSWHDASDGAGGMEALSPIWGYYKDPSGKKGKAVEDDEPEKLKEFKKIPSSTEAAIGFRIMSLAREQQNNRASVLLHSKPFYSTNPLISPTSQTISFTPTPRQTQLSPTPSDDPHDYSSVSSHYGTGDLDIRLPIPEPIRRKSFVTGQSFFTAPPKQLKKSWKKDARAKQKAWKQAEELAFSRGAAPSAQPTMATEQSEPVPASPMPSEFSDTRRHTFLEESDTGPQLRRLGTVGTATEASSVSEAGWVVVPTVFEPLLLVPPTAWLFIVGFLLPFSWWAGSFYPIADERGMKEYWGSLRHSPTLSTRTSQSYVEDPEKALHQRELERMPASGPLSGWKPSALNDRTPDFEAKHTSSRFNQFFSESQRRDESINESFWAYQRAIFTWKLRCRLLSAISIFILLPILIIGVVTATT